MGKKANLKVIEDFLLKLGEDFSVENIILFGSRARGNVRRDSDFDLIIVSDDFEGMDFFERASKMYDYWDSLHPVDFLCYTKKEFDRLKKRISIVREALSSGVFVR
jgi:uncharacterized protein